MFQCNPCFSCSMSSSMEILQFIKEVTILQHLHNGMQYCNLNHTHLHTFQQQRKPKTSLLQYSFMVWFKFVLLGLNSTFTYYQSKSNMNAPTSALGGIIICVQTHIINFLIEKETNSISPTCHHFSTHTLNRLHHQNSKSFPNIMLFCFLYLILCSASLL
jgi:hypothetical protein